MATTADIRTGLVIEHKGNRLKIVSFLHVKPGKGGAFVRTKLKNIITGQVIDETFRSGEKIIPIRIETQQMQYLYSQDNSHIFMNTENYNQIEIYTQYPENIEILKSKILSIIQANKLNLFAITWKDRNSSLINALKVEKNVMFLILTLIIFVASMNIISGLIIFVKEKNKDIGILKTFGLSDYSILKIFFSIGMMIGFMGAILGVLLGIIFSLNIDHIQLFLETILSTKLFAEEIYYLSSLPSEISIKEILIVFFTSIFICIFSTIFPALRSSNIDPIKTIRNE